MSNKDFDFSGLVGHQANLDSLRAGGRESPFPSLIFSGPRGVGKRLTAVWYAAYLNCLDLPEKAPCGRCRSCQKLRGGHHPDLLLTRVEEKKTVIGVGEVRDITHQVSFAPFEGRFRIWLIEEGEHLSDEAQNALLKTLEEPPSKAVIILVTQLLGGLLPTVSSRCRGTRFQALPEKESAFLLQGRGVPADQARRLARLSQGAFGQALTLAQNPELLACREKAIDLFLELPGSPLHQAMDTAQEMEKLKLGGLADVLEIGTSIFRDLLLLGQGCRELVSHGHRTEDLERLSERLPARAALQALEILKEAQRYHQSNVAGRLLLQQMCQGLAKGILP